MSDATAQAGAPPASGAASASPWLIAVLVALATFMEVLDTTIANVVLPYIAGGMGVSDDEASWVVTTYLVANAISLTASPFLARALGRKPFFLICLGLFSVSSILCALAWNLDSLLLFRVLQGLAGGGMVPVSQSILADFVSAAEARAGLRAVRRRGGGRAGGRADARRLAGRQFQLALVLSDQRPGRPRHDRADRHPLACGQTRDQGQAARFDVIGFLLVATFLGALEIVLDRGLEDDWFASNFIVTFTAICALAFVLMIPWEMTRTDPMIDVRMVATRQFGACFVVMGATGAILYATTQFLPLMLQTDFGYTATWAGLVLSPGGIVTMFMMFVVGNLSSRIQPKYLIMTGAIFAAISMYQMTNVYGDLGFWFFARTRMVLGLGLPLIFIPIITASYDGIPPNRVDMASALINAARNTGGSIGVSLASNLLNHREQFHQSRLIENAIPSSMQYQDTLRQVTHYFLAHGSLPPEAQGQAVGWIGQQVAAQSSYLAYMDVFWVLTLLSLAAVPLALSLRKVKLGGAAPAAH